MRTTLTIENDVAAALERMRRSQDLTMKDLVNQALRYGLKRLEAPPQSRKPFRTRSVSAGRFLIGNLDDISEVLAVAEGENHH